MKFLGVVVFVQLVKEIVGPIEFDPTACNETVPCCVSSDDTIVILGSFSKTFCKIEYPVRTTVQWNKSIALKWDRKARQMVQNLTALGCDSEACTVLLL
jgi:hypothetical protein